MIHLYAIAEGLGELPAVEGIGGAELRPRALDDLELVVSEHDGAELEPTEEAVLARARVVAALYLADADDVAGSRGKVAAPERAHPELTFVCTGPWPPYSFASPAAT